MAPSDWAAAAVAAMQADERGDLVGSAGFVPDMTMQLFDQTPTFHSGLGGLQQGYPVGDQYMSARMLPQQPMVPSLPPPVCDNAATTAGARAQRTSARQAAKAKAADGAAGGSSLGGKRTRAASRQRRYRESDTESDESDSDDGLVPQRVASLPEQVKPHDIAKTKYNHIQDEKERKRLKRLLRNRVSAQQARERKKAYLGTLEFQHRETNDKIRGLENKCAALERENFMLRQIVKTSTGRLADDHLETNNAVVPSA